ncbi:MAG TPA: PIG-L deacetylase family protein [Gemmatimonadaceae bacterium]|nr:PIG-L deacetylase family protein [Gemmatimonadaceae bacterium]
MSPKPNGNGSTRPAAVAEKHERVLVVVAHPDDPEFLFGATIARLREDGAEVGYVICSNGANYGRDPEKSPREVMEMRYAEQRSAAAVFGIEDIVFLGFVDGQLEANLELRRAIAREIRRARPDLVLTHYPRRVLDIPMQASHPDHMAVGEATLAAVFPTAANARILPELLAEGLEPHRVPEVWVPGYERPNHVVDAQPFFDRKMEALRCHRSQMDNAGEVPEWVAWFMKMTGERSGLAYAEDFKRITV